MVDDTTEEKDFRERYASELRKKKARSSINPNFGFDELSDEMRKVKHQELVTPGRRGEQIKHEEISKEIVRRLNLKSQKRAKYLLPMLMLKCKTCGEVFPGIYVPEGSSSDFRSSATNSDTSHTCSRGHKNEYATDDYLDWS